MTKWSYIIITDTELVFLYDVPVIDTSVLCL
jgi:hypothetical protein